LQLWKLFSYLVRNLCHFRYPRSCLLKIDTKSLARGRVYVPQFCTSSYRRSLVYTGWVSLPSGVFVISGPAGVWDGVRGERRRDEEGGGDRGSSDRSGWRRRDTMMEFRHPQEMRERSSVWNKLPGWDFHHLLELVRNSASAVGGLAV